ncbi:MAG: sugar nucleotide-binding protein, partial [Proteobacteria bacterium]|nr:sugar nucleotide-binding protein [Pseudomonadota bacterium]
MTQKPTANYLVLGKNGQLGRCLVRSLAASAGCELVAAYGHDELNLGDRDAIFRMSVEPKNEAPVWVLNAAADTAVDLCESELDACMAVNGAA